MRLMLLFVLCILLTFDCFDSVDTVSSVSSCAQPKSTFLDVFYVNLDHSTERRVFMDHQLQYFHFLSKDKLSFARIRAVMPKHFIIPKDIAVPWNCLQISNESITSIISEDRNTDELEANILITAHCGRPRNIKREMAVTLSHLFAIKAATDNIQSSHTKYALILEDDMEFAYDINFKKLVSSAPKGWGILQLITSNSYDINQLWDQYKNKGWLWTLRSYHDLWCAGGYIINKDILRPIINGIFRPLQNGWIGISIIAGYDKPCTPSFCCTKQGNKTILSLESPCVRSPRGYQSDHFIFSLTDGATYMLHVPILSGARTGNRSTLHQDHVSIHVESFRRINAKVEQIRSGKAIAPDFIANKTCKYIRPQERWPMVSMDHSLPKQSSSPSSSFVSLDSHHTHFTDHATNRVMGSHHSSKHRLNTHNHYHTVHSSDGLAKFE